MLGEAIFVSNSISPVWRAPISTIQNFVSSLALRIVSGTPISVFKFACVATVFPTCVRMPAKYSLVVVLPCDPVMPITCIAGRRSRTALVNCNKAAPTSFTKITGPGTGFETRANFAPFAMASKT